MELFIKYDIYPRCQLLTSILKGTYLKYAIYIVYNIYLDTQQIKIIFEIWFLDKYKVF